MQYVFIIPGRKKEPAGQKYKNKCEYRVLAHSGLFLSGASSDRVVSTLREWMAAENSPDRKYEPPAYSMPRYRFICIAAAGRQIATGSCWKTDEGFHHHFSCSDKSYHRCSPSFHVKNHCCSSRVVANRPSWFGIISTSMLNDSLPATCRLNNSLNIRLMRFRCTAFPLALESATATRERLRPLRIQYTLKSRHRHSVPVLRIRINSFRAHILAALGNDDARTVDLSIPVVGNGKLSSSLSAPAFEYEPSALGCASSPEAVLVGSFSFRRLECSFHL